MPTPARGAVVALDLGSSSVRALVCDELARPLPGLLARREVPPRQGDGGRSEVDPDHYVGELVACLDELAERGLLDGVTAVATSSQWHSVLALGEDGRPASPVLGWLDTRARPRAEPADPEAFHARTGTWPHTLYWTAKIPWLAGQGAGPRYAGLPDYVRAVLLDDGATSLSVASGTGMLDLDAGRWDQEALDLAGVTAEALPTISDEPARLAPRWRRRWPALADVPWQPVVGDGAASNVGSGCGSGELAAVTVGTSAALRVVHPAGMAPPPWPVWRYRVDPGRMVSGIAFSGGGVLHAWASGLLRLGADAEPTVAPGSHGLVCLPLHAGGRPPETIAPGSGALVGLSLDTTADEVLAATLEGVALEIARALDTLETAFERRFDIVLGGGGTASAWWLRVFAAAFDRPVRVAQDPEVGARGAAALALRREPGPPEQVVAPDPADVARLRDLRTRYEQLRTRLQ